MTTDEDLRDRRLLAEISRITNEYGALHRRTVRDLARSRVELARARTVLGTVAHDLRTPLTTVQGFTELLLDENLPAAQRDLCERIHHASLTMTKLTDELVDAVTLGNAPMASAPVDLTRLVTHVITRHQLLHPARGVRVVLDRPPTGANAAIIEGDQTKLERLVDNLISNALKFSPDRGVVRVSVTPDGEDVEIRVSDDGPGLPPEQLSAVFSPFHRAPGAADVPGVGLGLTIVKQIAERHGGRVHVESVLGAGATFVVLLPLAAGRGD